ncbi:spore coat protein JA [Melghirimyces profundicolus]|uniref:Spore coat protein JA n=1 Tax=Melghirimyces profundicolus TaxID=1242148 RepID=A0A2T6BST6_9BACL|nr:spore coat associated protein CotJA [Melghirimyces profundicolus]PTX59099.1 spore coat protein JA [Melghirimyces profundicolus]
MYTYRKYYEPYVSPLDPCPPMRVKSYETPPQLYMGFQPPNLPQYHPREALKQGTLWPALFAPYTNPYKGPGGGVDGGGENPDNG